MLFRLREAEEGDAAPVATFFRRVRQACLPYLPNLHTPEEDLAYFAKRVIGQIEVRIAEVDGTFVGFSAYRPGWLDHLYVDPDWHGRRIGTALLRDAMAANTSLELWTFQKNEEARGFYEHHGFREVERTDGAGNEEREPDIRYAWRRG
jgi:GNAT superfamily N-acetyltransferase